MPETTEALILGLMQTRDAILRRIGELHAQLQPLQRDLDMIGAMLARYRASSPPPVSQPTIAERVLQAASTATSVLAAAGEFVATVGPAIAAINEREATEDTASDEGQEGQEDTLDQTVASLVQQLGTIGAARRFCEWLLRNDMVDPPVPVRLLLMNFPPSLRDKYSFDDTAATETLRSQIKAWITRGETALTYESGQVDIQGRGARTEARPA
jgi:hypothetical protein